MTSNEKGQRLITDTDNIKGPFPGKWHVFVLALLYVFECLNESRQNSDELQLLETSVGNVIGFKKNGL